MHFVRAYTAMYEERMALGRKQWAFDPEARRAKMEMLTPGGLPSQFNPGPACLAEKRDEIRAEAARRAFGLVYWFRVPVERSEPTLGINTSDRGFGEPPLHATDALAAYEAHHRRKHEAYQERGEAEQRRYIDQRMARQRAEAARIRAMSVPEYMAYMDALERKRELKWEAMAERDRYCEEYPQAADYYRMQPLSFFREGADAADQYDAAHGFDLGAGAGSDDDAGSESGDECGSLAGAEDGSAAADPAGECAGDDCGGSDDMSDDEGECDDVEGIDDEGLFCATQGW